MKGLTQQGVRMEPVWVMVEQAVPLIRVLEKEKLGAHMKYVRMYSVSFKAPLLCGIR